jgi:hypothetical protein
VAGDGDGGVGDDVPVEHLDAPLGAGDDGVVVVMMTTVVP